MLLSNLWILLCVFEFSSLCEGQHFKFKDNDDTTTTPLPFPPCRANDIDCLRRGLRTFFFLMDAGYLGMTPVDPTLMSSVAVLVPEQQMSILLRRINVTGARWSRLAERKFNLMRDKSGVKFKSDLHVLAEITVAMAARAEPLFAFITMDMQDVETNITYTWSGQKGFDKEDYISISRERITVRNTRIPTFFVQPNTDDAVTINQLIESNKSILDHLSNEIVAALMNTVFDNFRLFASKIPVKYYYKYF